MVSVLEDSGLVQANSVGRPFAVLLPASMLLYAFSMMKFYTRDAVSTQTGPQGVIEVLLVMGSALALLPSLHALRYRVFVPSSAKAFMLFGALAAVSSAFSFDPLLSFVKAMSFLLVCGIAVTASTAFSPSRVLSSLFYAVITVLGVGLIYKLVSGEAWFAVDEYSGRERFSLFASHPATLADICALVLLTSMILRKRPPMYLRIALFGLNVATTSRTSTALLVVVLLVCEGLAVRFTLRKLFVVMVLCCLATLCVWIWPAGSTQSSGTVESASHSLYGNNLGGEIGSLNGRTEVWNVAGKLVSKCLLLGYGIDGARDLLINETSWNAGNAHNATLELILAGGVPATIVFFVGWAGAGRHAWLSGGSLRIRTLGIFAYMLGFGLTGTNLTYEQSLGAFLIITLDMWQYEYRADQNSLLVSRDVSGDLPTEPQKFLDSSYALGLQVK